LIIVPVLFFISYRIKIGLYKSRVVAAVKA